MRKVKNLLLKKSMKIPKPEVKCEECKFKAPMIQMKMHMKRIHGPRETKTQTRLQNFTPALKLSKKQRSEIEMDMALNMEGIIEADNSVFLSKENVSVEAVSLEEFTFSSSDKVEQEANKVEQEADKVEILSLLSCDQREYDCETQDELKNYIDSTHGNFLIMDCKCKFTTNEENVLKVHNKLGLSWAKLSSSWNCTIL